MKKWIALVLLLVLLTGCAQEKKLVVDTENHTLSDGTYTYEYSDTTSADARTIIIRYPDGGTYTWTQTGDKTQGQMICGPGISSSANGEVLVQAILNPQKEETEHPSLRWVLIVLGIPVAVLGLLEVLYPVVAWDLFLRRRYQEDPGAYALTRIISGGIGGIFLGVVLILMGIFV